MLDFLFYDTVVVVAVATKIEIVRGFRQSDSFSASASASVEQLSH